MKRCKAEPTVPDAPSDLCHLEHDIARVSDYLRSDPNHRWAVVHEIRT
jgi:hypothetical protein